jgi:hypothetical protein
MRTVTSDEMRIEDVQSLFELWLAAEVWGTATPTLAEKIRSPLSRASCRVERLEPGAVGLSVRYTLEALSFAPDSGTDGPQG